MAEWLQRADANGEPLNVMELACLAGKGGEILTVKFPGTPAAGLRQGVFVKVTGLTITDWSVKDRFGLTFRALKVEPLAAPGQKAGAA